jgi:transposase, IS30 family
VVQKTSLKEREQIFKLLSEKAPMAKIANQLGRNKSTIYRELQRLPQNAYSPTTAHVLASIKAKNSKKKEKLQNKELRDYVTQKLMAYWSPEQISNRLLLDYPQSLFMRISHETIYRFVYRIKDPYEKAKLILCLRQRKKKRLSRKRKKGRRTNIPNLTSIWDRPKEIEARKELGHWEGDLIIGKGHTTAIGTLVERRLRYTLIVPLLKNKFSVTTVVNFAKAFESLPKSLTKSLTYDRGSEMSWHEVLTKNTGISVFFADPHSPWQRGTNENTNGLIRQFFPKRTDFSKCTIEDLQKVQDLLNSRPRKVLGFRTPQEKLTALMK